MVTYVFLVAAAVAIIFALLAIVHRSPVVNVLSLLVLFFALATIYAVLGMDFLAAMQLIVYAGAVLVLFLFVIMLLNIKSVERLGSGRPLQLVLGALTSITIAVVTVLAILRLTPVRGAVLPGAAKGTVYPLGHALLTTHTFAFELISVLLVASLVGAYVLARKEDR